MSPNSFYNLFENKSDNSPYSQYLVNFQDTPEVKKVEN